MHIFTARPNSESSENTVSPEEYEGLSRAVVTPDDEFARTHQTLINSLEELSLVEDIARQLSSSLSFDEIVNKMLEIALRMTLADRAALATLSEPGNSWLVMLRRSGETQTRKSYRSRGRDDGIFGEVMRTRLVLRLADASTNPRFAGLEPGESRSILAVPLIRDEQVIGILTLESHQPNFFKDEEQNFLIHLAGHTVISMDNHRMLEEHQHRIDLLSSLQFLSMRANAEPDVAGVEKAVRETARRMFLARDAAIFYYNPFTDELSDPRVDDSTPRRLFPAHESLRAARTNEIQITHHSIPLSLPIDVDNDQLPPLTFVSVPIKGSHALQAVLSVTFAEHRSLRQRDIDALHLLAYQAGEHLEKAHLQESIRAAHDRMSAILHSTRDGVLFLDREGRLVEMNASAERLVGIRKEDVLNKNFVAVLFHMMDKGELTGMGYSQSQLVELARQLRTQPSRITKREFSRMSDGKTIYIEEIGSPVMDTQHHIVGRLLVLRDVTEQKQLTEFRQDIINMAVHDLRGPLGAIISGLEMAMEDLQAYPEKDLDVPSLIKLVGLSRNSAGNLIELVESVLEIARLETREMPLERAVLPLSLIVQNAHDALQNGYEAAEITVETDLPPDLPPVYVDQKLIRRVLVNLLDNALRHTPTGGRVRVFAERSAHHPSQLVVYVADSGRGIPASEHKNVFEVFRQIKSNVPYRGSRGSGLGLTFCRLAVEAHEGDIWVEEASPLGGACIAFSIPLALHDH